MEGHLDNVCEWSGCPKPSFERVRFGLRLFEPEVASTKIETGYPIHELNLCSKHIAEVKKYFRIVIIGELTQAGGSSIRDVALLAKSAPR